MSSLHANNGSQGALCGVKSLPRARLCRMRAHFENRAANEEANGSLESSVCSDLRRTICSIVLKYEYCDITFSKVTEQRRTCRSEASCMQLGRVTFEAGTPPTVHSHNLNLQQAFPNNAGTPRYVDIRFCSRNLSTNVLRRTKGANHQTRKYMHASVLGAARYQLRIQDQLQ
jgi:hypothetical protein